MLLTPTTYAELNIFDEGFVASGALEMLRGGLPIRDFFVIYGPGVYFLNALAFAVFGEDLAVMRALHLGWLGLLMAMAASLASRLAPLFPRCAGMFVAVVATAFAAAFPLSSGSAAVPATLFLMLGISALQPASGEARPSAGLFRCSCWIGVAALFRWDFGFIGFVAAALTLRLGRPSPVAAHWLVLIAPAGTVWLALFMPLVLVGDAATWWAEVPWFHLREFPKWRGLAFVAPELARWDAFAARGQTWLAILRWAAFFLPFLLVGLTAAMLLRRRRCRKVMAEHDRLALGLLVLTLGLLSQLRVRTDLAHGFPALMAALPLAAYLFPQLPRRWGIRLGAVGAAMAVAVLGHFMLRASVQSERVDLVRNSNWRVIGNTQAAREYAAMIVRLRELIPPGERLYSGVRDTSRLWVNDAMLYFLCDRRPATRWIEMEPGLFNTQSNQRLVIGELQRHSPTWIVLLEALSQEPNLTAQSNGPSALDAYVSEHYSLTERWGNYSIMKRRSGPDVFGASQARE